MKDALREALKTEDMETLKRTAHALKGMVGNFQAHSTYETAAKLEDICRQGHLDGADEAFEELSAELERLEKMLRDLVREGTE